MMAAEYDLASFSFFQRGSVQEAMNFMAKTTIERTNPGVRTKVEEAGFLGNVFVRSDGLAGVIATDQEYPARVAFSVLNRILDEFSQKFPRSNWRGLTPATTGAQYPELKMALEKCQNPSSADPMMRVQQELDETKIVLHKTMESLLQRGEKLDDLVSKSDQLSSQSKVFYKTAKSTNQCCTYY
ncbi:MAG: hypothetical protein SGCHY_003030 [Lobulomycetales sp.]